MGYVVISPLATVYVHKNIGNGTFEQQLQTAIEINEKHGLERPVMFIYSEEEEYAITRDGKISISTFNKYHFVPYRDDVSL